MSAGRKKMMLALLGCSLLACSLLLSRTAMAQGHPGGGGGQGGGNPGGGHGGGRNDNGRGDGGGRGTPGMNGQMQGGMGGRGGVPVGPGNGGRGGVRGGAGSLQMGPVGRWWDEKGYSNALGLRTDQRKRMDAIFNEHRGELASRYQALRTEESKLEEATRDSKVSQGSVFGQIDRVAQARDALEKTNEKLLGALRKELDVDQAARMQTLK